MRFIQDSLLLLPLTVGLVGADLAHGQSTLAPARRDWMTHTPNGPVLHSHEGWQAIQQGVSIGLTGGPTALRWSLLSDGSWIADAIALSANGTRVVAEHGPFDNRVRLFSGHDVDEQGDGPEPIWEDVSLLANMFREVRAAADSDDFVSLQQIQSGQGTGLRQALLRKYSLGGPTPDWTYLSPTTLVNNPFSAVRISDDGQRIALAVFDQSSGGTRLTVFGADDSTPLMEATVSSLGPFQAFELSSDGSTAVVGSTLRLSFVDTATGTVLHQQPMMGAPQYGAIALSGDGSVVALGTLNEVRFYARQTSGGYSLSSTHPLPPSNYARRVTISREGSTAVMGFHAMGDPLTAKIRSLDLATGAILVEAEYTGGGQHQNMVVDISMTRDGQRFAVGLWGDEEGLVPHVLVFRSDSNTPILAEYLDGSVMRLQLSADGSHLAVASKGVHANVWGGGGSLSLFEVGRLDLDVLGAPRIGTTVELRQRLRPGARGRILQSASLADTPGPAPELGTGVLYLDPLGLIELPETVADEEGARTPFVIPNDPSLVGQTVYIQGLQVDDGILSRTWIPLTILP